MNTILLTAVLGIVLMMIGAFSKSKTLPRFVAIGGIIVILIANMVELLSQESFFTFNVKNMLTFNSFNLAFIGVALLCTLIYFLISGSAIEKVGSHVAEYFALLFFVLCGVAISATFNTLLMLFIGIEIISIPLYILTGSDKRNLKSNEAALKYFLMGAFSTGIMLMGIAFIYGGNEQATFYISQL